MVLFPRFDALPIVDALVRHRATMLEGVPTMYHYLLNCPSFGAADLSSLRLCTVGGQTIGVEMMQAVEAIVRCPLVELWGMTKLGGLGTTHAHLTPPRRGSIGVALPGTETKLVALDDESVPAGTDEPGELLVRGPTVMLGYYGHREATVAAITHDGWLLSGDVARHDAEGYLYIARSNNPVQPRKLLTGGHRGPGRQASAISPARIACNWSTRSGVDSG